MERAVLLDLDESRLMGATFRGLGGKLRNNRHAALFKQPHASFFLPTQRQQDLPPPAGDCLEHDFPNMEPETCLHSASVATILYGSPFASLGGIPA